MRYEVLRGGQLDLSTMPMQVREYDAPERHAGGRGAVQEK